MMKGRNHDSSRTKRGRKEQVFVPKQRGGLVKTCSFAISSKMSLNIVFDYSKFI